MAAKITDAQNGYAPCGAGLGGLYRRKSKDADCPRRRVGSEVLTNAGFGLPAAPGGQPRHVAHRAYAARFTAGRFFSATPGAAEE